jgi:hypothetical protein
MGEGKASLSGVKGREDMELGVGSSPSAIVIKVLIRNACRAGL